MTDVPIGIRLEWILNSDKNGEVRKMQYDKSDALLVEAFATVEKYDPATYARMVGSEWIVSEDVRKAFPEYWMDVIHDETIITSFGVTMSDASEGLNVSMAETWIVPWMIGAYAESDRVSPATFVADVLVHEFAHIHADDYGKSGGELEATRAGLAFAHLLPGQDGRKITALAAQHLKDNS